MPEDTEICIPEKELKEAARLYGYVSVPYLMRKYKVGYDEACKIKQKEKTSKYFKPKRPQERCERGRYQRFS